MERKKQWKVKNSKVNDTDMRNNAAGDAVTYNDFLQWFPYKGSYDHDGTI